MFIFFLTIIFRNILTIPLLIRKYYRLMQALVIPTGLPMTAVNKQRETPLPVPQKTSKVLS